MIDASDKPICFLELVSEAEDFLVDCEHSDKSPEGYEIIALSLEVQAYLLKRNVAYTNTLELFNKDDHAQVMYLIDEYHCRFEELFQLDLTRGEIRITFTDSAIFVAQYYINYFLFILTIVDKAASSSGLVVSAEPKKNLGRASALISGPPHISSREGFASALVCEYCRVRQIKHRVFKGAARELGVTQDPVSDPFSGRAARLFYRGLEKALVTKRLVLFLGGGGTNGNAIPDLLAAHDQILTIVFSERIGMREVLVGWARFFRILSGAIPVSLEAGDGGLQAAVAARLDTYPLERLKNQFIYKNVDFYAVFGLKIGTQLIPYLKNLASRVERRLVTMNRLSIDSVVATGAREENLAVGGNPWCSFCDGAPRYGN